MELDKLENAKQKLEEFIGIFYEFPNPTSVSIRDYEVTAIETVLQALKELQQKEKSRIIGNINEIKIEDLEPILKPYYIPKEKVKYKIEKLDKEYKEILSDYGNIDTDITFSIPNKNVRKHLDELIVKIIVLQELLEE